MTDRAARYRANSRACRPPEPRICAFCGRTQNVEVHHIDGHEENTDPANLVWACRSCNTSIGFALRKAGLGRLTRQYNPASNGARTLGQWVTAVLSMKGQGPMETTAAVEMIHATSPSQRSKFAQDIWQRRRQRGTDKRK
ncbi:MAG: HNH endonuclease [Acidobacteriia bacterium]|nr:HNH endonuclease [Terriglobia bacterium]